jgi:molybdopterin-guanine dinucleotide biosynthesis protein A
MGESDAVFQFGAPVLAVCGFSGSGKTTLLEAVIPRLVERGLAVAVVKHDAHGFEVDKPGKDSDRFFRAGATVALSGPGQQFERRGAGAVLSLSTMLARLGCEHDVVLVEGHKDIALPKLWLSSEERQQAPESVTNILRTLRWNADRVTDFMEFVYAWLPSAWTGRPLYGGMLVGGMSSRMGSAKQLMRFGESTMGEIVAGALGGALGAERCVALGAGELPAALSGYVKLPDPPGFGGPAAALIAAHRWCPEAAWIVAACDHPWLRAEQIRWLVSHRQATRWAVIPQQRDGRAYPMLALYEPQALEALERMACDAPERARPAVLLDSPRTFLAEVPVELMDGWKNVNTPEELQMEETRLQGSGELAE